MKPLRDAEREALLKLLADDDEHTLDLLGAQLETMGADGREFLVSATQRASPAARRSALQILTLIRERETNTAFEQLCTSCGSDLDLEQACWLLAKTRYHELDEAPYRARLDQMARELRERLTGRETPRATIEVCNHYLFQMLEFHGNRQDYYDPDNSYLNRVLDRRLGIPISLSTVYLCLTRRLGLPLFGVNLPGHFLLKWRSPDVEFFIDPFNQGRLLNPDECQRLSEQLTGEFNRSYLSAVTTKTILIRICRNLQAIYRGSDLRRADQLSHFIQQLTAQP